MYPSLVQAQVAEQKEYRLCEEKSEDSLHILALRSLAKGIDFGVVCFSKS